MCIYIYMCVCVCVCVCVLLLVHERVEVGRSVEPLEATHHFTAQTRPSRPPASMLITAIHSIHLPTKKNSGASMILNFKDTPFVKAYLISS